jgi:hypothetical protein
MMQNSSCHINNKIKRLSILYLGLIILFIATPFYTYAQNDILKERFSFENQRASLYDILNVISKKTGYYFIYDSKIVENDKRVKLDAKNEILERILNDILNDPSLKFRTLGKHILIYKDEKKSTVPSHTQVKTDTTTQWITVTGKVWDEQLQHPLPYVSVAIEGTSEGTVTNGDGVFLLKVRKAFESKQIAISHIGFKTYKLPIELTKDQKVDIYLKQNIISLQEVVIRRVDPLDIVNQALKNRKENYATHPVYLSTFYREGVQKNGKYLSYIEALLKIYKPSFDQSFSSDLTKEIKSRKITNTDNSDTLIMKIRGGISACLSLDIVRSMPDFLDRAEMQKYRYSLSDIVTFESRNAYSIFFEQVGGVEDALFTGNLYIDTDSLAILGADFEINPKYIQKATDYLIEKRTNSHIVKPERYAYTVTYRKIGSTYYLNHAQCNIQIKARKKGRLFSNSYSCFLEMATCDVETSNITKFSRQETIKPQTIYLDTPYTYDPNFWGEYNVIVPEEKISEALKRINAKIEKTEHPQEGANP